MQPDTQNDQPPASAPEKPAPTEPAPPPVMRPLDWYRLKGTKWPLACLAAALSGWDRRCDDDCLVTSDEYDMGVALAELKYQECVTKAAELPDSSARRRVFILTSESEMDAVVAYKPGVAEATALMTAVKDPDADPKMRTDAAASALWDRCLWPPIGPERGRIMDDNPVGYGQTLPLAYLAACGMSYRDVRKKP